jgi:hypothetical protein
MLDVSMGCYTAIGYYWDAQRGFDLPDDLPIARAHELLVVLPSSAMHHKHGAASGFHDFGECYGIGLAW